MTATSLDTILDAAAHRRARKNRRAVITSYLSTAAVIAFTLGCIAFTPWQAKPAAIQAACHMPITFE